MGSVLDRVEAETHTLDPAQSYGGSSIKWEEDMMHRVVRDTRNK